MKKLAIISVTAVTVILFLCGATKASQPSGAASFHVEILPYEISVDGDPVNISIQVLDEGGMVNLLSNGQEGDVLFSVTSELGT